MAAADPGHVVILGAGPAGLGAAYRLEEVGFSDYVVIEAADRAGGLASSDRDPQGFTWDIGGHVQYSHYAYYDSVLDRALGDSWLWHERESWIWIKGRFVPYPFQNNLHRLDPSDRDRALAGLEAVAEKQSPPGSNFADWILVTFGAGVAELFMVPYNRKVWGYPLERMNASWIGDRVARPDLVRLRRNLAEERDDVSWGPNRRFRFPLEGGTGAIWQAVAALLPSDRIRYRRRVTTIDLSTRLVRLSDGQSVRYDTLISTLPLDVLSDIAEPVSPHARAAARKLLYSSVFIIGVGLRGEKPDALTGKCWMYFPEPHSPYHRVTVFSHYSPRNVPAGDGYWSLMAEVCQTPRKSVDGSRLRQDVVAAMRHDDLLPGRVALVSYWQRRVEHGYPTPSVGRDEALVAIQSELAARRVYSRGRFGAWKYEVSNQDHSFMQGVELVNFLLRGEPEVTAMQPDVANSGVFLETHGLQRDPRRRPR